MKLPKDLEAAVLATPGVVVRAASPADAGPAPKPKPKRARKPAKLVAPGVVLEFTVPYRPANESNRRDWRARSRRTKLARTAWWEAMLFSGLPGTLWDALPLPLTVTMTRLGGRRMDSDGEVSGFKGLRDAVARWVGLDDGDRRLTWAYGAWEPGPLCGVRVRVESRGGGP